MNSEQAVDFLVEHVAKIDAEMATKVELAAVKAEFAGLREDVRAGTQAMRHYTTYVQTTLNLVAKGQLFLEDRTNTMASEIDQMKQRIADLEKRNPAA